MTTLSDRRAAQQAARELRLRAIIATATKLIAKPNSVTELEFVKACRAEFDDGKGFDAAWESAVTDAGWDEDAGDYACNVRAGEAFDRSRRVDLAIAMGAR